MGSLHRSQEAQGRGTGVGVTLLGQKCHERRRPERREKAVAGGGTVLPIRVNTEAQHPRCTKSTDKPLKKTQMIKWKWGKGCEQANHKWEA